jgi:hypothetical protein
MILVTRKYKDRVLVILYVKIFFYKNVFKFVQFDELGSNIGPLLMHFVNKSILL